MNSPASHPATSNPVTPDMLRALLAGFTGTETYYRHALARHIVYTDGVKAFADTAGAYWLIDILATELPRYRNHGMVFATCNVSDGKATLQADHDEGRPNIWERPIDYTDCPEGAWRFWMAEGGPDDTIVIMLPSEY